MSDDCYIELPEFEPCVLYVDGIKATQMLLEDVVTVWVPWGPYKGYAVDIGYAVDDSRIVGITIWDDVRKRPDTGIPTKTD